MDLGGAVAAVHHPEAILVCQELHVDGPVLLDGALGQQDVLQGIHQQHVAGAAQGAAAVLKEDGLVEHPLGVKVAFAGWGRTEFPALAQEMKSLCDYSFDSPKELERFLFEEE